MLNYSRPMAVLFNLFDTMDHWKKIIEAEGRIRKLKSKY
jgi:hypothetical protein